LPPLFFAAVLLSPLFLSLLFLSTIVNAAMQTQRRSDKALPDAVV
jgi:hypothetical protein